MSTPPFLLPDVPRGRRWGRCFGLWLGLILRTWMVHANDTSSAWLFHAWETNDGLPNNDVTGVAQAADGAMLFATHAGLARFDGWRLSEVSTSFARKSAREISGVLTAREGPLWLVKGGVLFSLKTGRDPVAVPISESALGPRLTSFFEQKDGTIWLAFEGKSPCRLAPRHRELSSVAGGIGSAVAEDAAGGIWLAGPGGLARWRDGRFQKMADLPNERISLCAARAGGLWIGAGRQLFYFTETHGLGEPERLPPGPPGASDSTMLEDRQGRLWFGTLGDGLYLRTGPTAESAAAFQKIALSNNDVWWLCEDHEGSLWVATGGGGVCRVRPRVLTMLEEPGAPVRQTARALCTDTRGDIWVILQTGRLFVRRGGEWQFLGEGTTPSVPLSTCIAAAPDGTVWIGTNESNLLRWDGVAFTAVPLPPKEKNRRIRALLCTRDGELWIGRTDSVLHGRPGDWRAVPIGAGEAQTLAEDATGRVWIGTSGGTLFRMEMGAPVSCTPAEIADNGGLRALLPTRDGALWIGTNGAGLARLKDGRCHVFTTAQGLPENVISQLALDTRSRLWAAGDRGIFLTALDELAAVVEGRAATVRSIAFGQSEGMPSLQANSGYTPNTLTSPDGRIWFATRRAGIALADPRTAGSNRVPPRVGIEEMRVDGRAIPMPTGFATIGPGAKDVRFTVSAMSFVAPAQVQIRHRLEGLNTDWASTSADRTASYSHLAPGSYTLRVRAANNDGVWSEQDATLAFIVRPFFWQRLSFQIAIAAALLTAAALAAHRLSERRLRHHADALRRETALERERTRIARDMHDQLGASLTQITLLSELARADGTDDHLPRLAETARHAVTALDEIVWAVNPRHDTLASLLDYLGQQVRDLLAAAEIRCRLDFPADPPPRQLTAEFRHHLFLIVREAVNNAVKYAAPSEVQVAVELSAKELRVTITDDGRGFTESASVTTSDGLQNMRTRAADLGGECRIGSHPGSGTVVTLQLPWP